MATNDKLLACVQRVRVRSELFLGLLAQIQDDVLRLTGIRRGFAGKRFPRRTREQFLANEAFINSAYPSDPQAE